MERQEEEQVRAGDVGGRAGWSNVVRPSRRSSIGPHVRRVSAGLRATTVLDPEEGDITPACVLARLWLSIRFRATSKREERRLRKKGKTEEEDWTTVNSVCSSSRGTATEGRKGGRGTADHRRMVGAAFALFAVP